MSDLITELTGNVLTITLNRPERMNAISGDMLTGIAEALSSADKESSVRCIVLTGAGRGFCSGLDLQDVGKMGGGSGLANDGGGQGQSAFKIDGLPPMVLRRIDTPVLCALNGPAAGYGMDLALGCDMILASDRSKMICPVRRGVVPESGGTWLLPRLVGWQKASEILLIGRPLEAARLLELGLVNRVFPHEELAAEVSSWAAEIAANAPLAVAATKRTMRLGLESSFDANAHHVMAELLQLFRTKDFGEALSAFLEKRDPTFEGR